MANENDFETFWGCTVPTREEVEGKTRLDLLAEAEELIEDYEGQYEGEEEMELTFTADELADWLVEWQERYEEEDE